MLHPITLYRTGFSMRGGLVLNVTIYRLFTDITVNVLSYHGDYWYY